MYNILPTHGISQLAGTCTDTKEIIWPKRHENSYKCTLHLERSKTKKIYGILDWNLYAHLAKHLPIYCISTYFSPMWVGWQQGKQWLIGCSSYIKPLSRYLLVCMGTFLRFIVVPSYEIYKRISIFTFYGLWSTSSWFLIYSFF